MKRFLSFAILLLSGTVCLAQHVFSAAEQKHTDSLRIAWRQLDDSLEKEWDNIKALIVNAPQLSAKEKEALTNYCARHQFISIREDASGLPFCWCNFLEEPRNPYHTYTRPTDTAPTLHQK